VVNPTEIIPGVIFYSYYSATRKEKFGFFEHNVLVLQVSGVFTMETASESVSMHRGQMLLIHRNQLVELTKTPLDGEDYQTIVIVLKEEMLRKMALEEQIAVGKKYSGPLNILIPENDFLNSFFCTTNC
jgi:hypothetical protein